jgi:Phage integrase family
LRQTANLRLVTVEAPTPLFGSTTRKRAAKHHKFLTEAQLDQLAKDAANHRDRTMIMTAYRHGLRVSELVSLRWDQIDLDAATMRIYRAKHGRDATHPIPGGELRDLRRLKRASSGEYVFISRLGGPNDSARIRSDARKDSAAGWSAGTVQSPFPAPRMQLFPRVSRSLDAGYPTLSRPPRSEVDRDLYRSGTDQLPRVLQVAGAGYLPSEPGRYRDRSSSRPVPFISRADRQ